MSVSLIAGTIIFLVVCSLIVSSVSYSRQKAIAQRRKQIANYKKIAEELIGYRDFVLAKDPSYDLLLVIQKQLVMALESALELIPSDEKMQGYVNRENANLQMHMSGSRSGKINPVCESDELLDLAKRQLSQILKHLTVVRNSGQLNANIFEKLNIHIKHLGLAIEFESHQHQANLCAEQGDVVLYQTHLKQARDALKKSPLENKEKNAKIKAITDTLNEVKRTNKIIFVSDKETSEEESKTSSEQEDAQEDTPKSD